MTDEIDEIKDIINSIIADLEDKKIFAELIQKKSNDVNFLDIGIATKNPTNQDQFNSLKMDIANVLSQYIIEKYERKFINRIINSNYCYFNPGEKREILKNALKNILNTDEKNIFNNLFLMRRKNIITKKLLEYFETSNELVLDGFVTFRLRDYVRELEEVVDKAVDDYLMEKEYREFIRLLKYFVEIQEPKLSMVHVITSYDSKYILLDNNKREITNECIEDFIKEVAEGEINYDDLLVSSLITLAPKRIYIHLVSEIQNKELVETIKNVFTGRVVFCPGCNLCLMNKAGVRDARAIDMLNK